MIKRRNYKEWCEAQKKHEKAEKEKIKNIKSEKEAWKYINKYRNQRSQARIYRWTVEGIILWC